MARCDGAMVTPALARLASRCGNQFWIARTLAGETLHIADLLTENCSWNNFAWSRDARTDMKSSVAMNFRGGGGERTPAVRLMIIERDRGRIRQEE